MPLLPAAGAAAGRDGRQGAAQLHLIVVGVYDDTGRYNNVDISDFITSKMQDPLSRACRAWATYAGVRRAIRHAHLARSLQAAQFQPDAVRRRRRGPGAEYPGLGRPDRRPARRRRAQQLNATVTAQSRLQTPEQFRDIILKTAPSGAVVRLGDVARVELGADTYAITSLFNGYAGRRHRHHAGARRQCAEDRGCGQGQGRDALRASLPPGMKLIYPDRQHRPSSACRSMTWS